MKNVFAVTALFFVTLASITTASRARGDVVSFSNSMPFSSVPALNVEVELPFFDPSLGTLTEISIDISATGSVDFDVQFDDLDNGGQAVAFIYFNFTALVGPGSIGGASELSGEEFYPGPGTDFLAIVSGGGGDFSLDPATVNMFVASMLGDSFQTEINFDDFTAVSDGTDFDVLNATAAFVNGGEVTVSYTFEAVPEPGSMIVLGLMSLAMVQTRRRIS